MSRIDELIERLCPDGVEYQMVSEVTTVVRGKRVVRKELSGETGYPVYQNSLEPLGYYEECNQPAGTTFVICAGAAGDVGYSAEDFWAADDCFCLASNARLNGRYAYHVLLSMQSQLKSQVRKASVPRLSSKVVERLPVPVPPMEVQEEVVRVLDSFAELEAELEARRRHYAHYRDELLDFAGRDDVRWMKLGDLFEMRNGYTPSKSNSEFWDDGTIPWFRMEDIRENGRVLADSIQHVSESAVKGKGLFAANSIIVATSATIGEHALIAVDALTNQRFTCLTIKSTFADQVDMKFAFYYGFILGDYCREHLNSGNFASVDMGAFRSFQFPIPPIEEQERIVAILDKFDALVNDISQGIPAEIEARRKQYEHYRDKLLSFKEKIA